MSNQLLSILSSIHQETLYYSLHETQQQNLLSDLLYFNSIYPGGIKEYMDRISSLLSSNPNSFSKYVSIDVLTFIITNYYLDSIRKRFEFRNK